MGKNKKSKKTIVKLAVPQTFKSLSQSSGKCSVGNGLFGTPSSSAITSIAKNGSAITIDGEAGHESVGTDLHIDIDSIDHSLTREPINLGVKNVRQIMACIKEGTIEVKDLILNECNIIYECKICSNLFRSLANFIAHKRIYCKNHFCEKMMLFDSTVLQFNHEEEDNCEENEVEDEEVPEEVQIDSTNGTAVDFLSPASSLVTTSSSENVNPNKDKTVIAPKRQFIENCVQKVENEKQKQQDSDLLELKLSSIKTNPNAVFQKLQTNELNSIDRVSEVSENCANINQNKKQIINQLFKDAKRDANNSNELNNIQALKRQRIEEILPRSDLESELNGSDVQTSDVNVKCDICNSVFTSSKTFKVHLRTIHSTNRLIFPCPLCSLTFKQLSNATRHIIQIHKRNKTQANTLREVMRMRAYSANSSENSSEVEDMSDDEENGEVIELSVESKVTSKETENESPIEKRVKESARINAPCVYNCGNIFDWAPAKRSHEKSCRKKFEQEKQEQEKQVTHLNGSSHSSLLSKNHRIHSFSSSISEIQAESSSQNQILSSELSIVANHTSNTSTNIILPNSVEEKIKEFTDLKSLICTLCPSQDFMNLNQLLQHAVAHIGYNIYRCHGCSYHSIYENDMKYHLMNNHNIGEDMISKHYQTLPTLTQPRLLIVPVKARKSINGPTIRPLDTSPIRHDTESQNQDKNSKLKIHLRTMGNTSKKCYEIVDK